MRATVLAFGLTVFFLLLYEPGTSQPLVLVKNTRTKQISPGSPVIIQFLSTDTIDSSVQTRSSAFGLLDHPTTDSVYLKCYTAESTIYSNKRQAATSVHDYVKLDSLPLVGIGKDQIFLVQRSADYKPKRVKDGLGDAFAVVGGSGVIVVITGLAVGEEEGESISKSGVWMIAVGAVGSYIFNYKKSFHTGRIIQTEEASHLGNSVIMNHDTMQTIVSL